MRVLFFLGSSNPFPGAGWTRVGFFADYFRRKGLKIEVVGTFSPTSLKKAGASYWNNIRIMNICPMLGIEVATLLNIIMSVLILPVLFFILRPNIVVISVPPGGPSIGAYIASKIIGAKIVYDVRDEWEDDMIMKSNLKVYRKILEFIKLIMTKIYIKSNLVVTVTENIVDSLKMRGVKEIRVIPNGADVNVFKPCRKTSARKKLGLTLDDFLLVFVGNVGRTYRLDVVVMSLAKLGNDLRRKVKLLIVGRNGLRKIIEIADIYGLKENIIYMGVKDDKDELAELLSAADVGVIPHDDNPLWKNAIPAKFYEYCACGLPVVATAYEDSLLAKLIKEYNIGLTVTPRDEKKLSQAIYLIYKDRTYREEAGKRARLLIEERFDRSKIAEKFFEMLKSLG